MLQHILILPGHIILLGYLGIVMFGCVIGMIAK